MSYQKTPIEELRAAVRFFDCWTESFNQQWDTEQLLAIYRYAVSEAGGRIDEDPTQWDEATLCKALGVPCDPCDAECIECRGMYASDDHPFPVCEVCR